MGSPEPDLSEWVAFKPNLFATNNENECSENKIKFIVGWNREAEKLAIIFHEGSRKASDNLEKNKASSLSVTNLFNIHQQLCLIDPSIDNHFPGDLRPSRSSFLGKIFPNSKTRCKKSQIHDSILSSIEQYLHSAVMLYGKKLVITLLFNEDDSLIDYEENINELRLKTLENAVGKSYMELEELLTLRKRAETLLETKTIYSLEDNAAAKISVALSELYNFQLMPFIELRELAHSKSAQAKTRLSDEIGPNIKKLAHVEFEEWNEEYLTAAQALQQLYQDYYRKTLSLVLAQRDRMLEDQRRFGKAAYSLHALPRLQKLEVQVCQEKLKLLNAIKSTQEFQRDNIKQQLTSIASDASARRELDRVEAEVAEAQKGVLDSHLEVLEVEERLYKSQLAILNQQHADDVALGIFYEAVENEEDLEDLECDDVLQNPKAAKLKVKLNKLYRIRAAVRNKKKALLSEERKRKELIMNAKEKEKKAVQIKRPERKVSVRELPAEKIKEERKKTLQRLKAFKKRSAEWSLQHELLDKQFAEEEQQEDSEKSFVETTSQLRDESVTVGEKSPQLQSREKSPQLQSREKSPQPQSREKSPQLQSREKSLPRTKFDDEQEKIRQPPPPPPGGGAGGRAQAEGQRHRPAQEVRERLQGPGAAAGDRQQGQGGLPAPAQEGAGADEGLPARGGRRPPVAGGRGLAGQGGREEAEGPRGRAAAAAGRLRQLRARPKGGRGRPRRAARGDRQQQLQGVPAAG